MFSARHWPRPPRWAGRRKRWMPRSLPVSPPGTNSTMSPTAISPSTGMPVTTAPWPGRLKTRSIGMRNTARRGCVRARAISAISSRKKSSIPSNVSEDTGATGAPARNVPLRKSRISTIRASTASRSTRSIFVSATIPRRTPSNSMICTCSMVCGITPSSAAMTSTASSMPDTPATMVRMNFSCPGTSTMPTHSSPPRKQGAKPNSIVSPRSFSSFSRSVSHPVSSLTRLVLP
ncbi:MAG: hypothetical protein BWZ10_03135 [candidate division BRC1 bacterium ADurb.BinA364]|nr:MAG: hypothetical protein BWZ10_03135 [candidate division BRC1 bacterium ADurb.BinA364]